MKKDSQKFVYGGLLLVAILAFAIYGGALGYASGGTSLYAQMDKSGQFGEPEEYFYANVLINYNNVIRYTVRGTGTVNADGETVTPKSTFDLEFAPKTNNNGEAVAMCQYSPSGSFYSGFISSSYGKNLGSPSKKIFYSIEPFKNGVSLGKTEFEGGLFDIQNFNDPDGDGKLVVVDMGYKQGQEECPQSSGIGSFDVPNDINMGIAGLVIHKGLYIVDKDDFNGAINNFGVYCASPLTQWTSQCQDAITYLTSPETASSWSNCKNIYWKDSSKSTAVCEIGAGGKVEVSVRASTEFFDSQIIGVPEVGVPVISCGVVPTIKEQTMKPMSFILGNDGDVSASFVVTATSSQVGVGSPQSIVIGSKKQNQITFQVSPGQVNDLTKGFVTFKACSSNELGNQNCASQTCELLIVDSSSVIPEAVCGNDICEEELGENYQDCAQDCEQPSEENLFGGTQISPLLLILILGAVGALLYGLFSGNKKGVKKK